MEQSRTSPAAISEPEEAAVPRQDEVSTRRAAPASEGLAAASRESRHKDTRRRERHPAKSGPMPLQTTEQLIAAAEANLSMMAVTEDETGAGGLAVVGKTPQEIAVALGVATSGKPVRALIKQAREAFAARAQDYADLHYLAAVNAAAEGDAKPAQWALERIAEGGDRIVDALKTTPDQPTLQIGIALGGIPLPAGPQAPRIEVRQELNRALPAPEVDAELMP